MARMGVVHAADNSFAGVGGVPIKANESTLLREDEPSLSQVLREKVSDSSKTQST